MYPPVERRVLLFKMIFNNDFMERNFRVRHCIICNTKFYVMKKGEKKGRRKTFIKRCDSVTCHHRCSRRYHALHPLPRKKLKDEWIARGYKE